MTRSTRAYAARALCLLALAALAAADARAQDTSAPAYKISYTLSMPEPASHLFHVRVDVTEVEGADHVDFQMPRWSPGRYAVFDFAKNVQEARFSPHCKPGAKCAQGLTAERLDTQTWRARTANATGVTFSYKVFADDLSGTFSQLDARHANFNGGSVFVYVVGHKQDAATLKVNAPPGWKVVHGRSTRADQTEFSFPTYDEL
ncbi:MAG TPA: hypothetical protein VF570_21335, partial [Pyrinomonadaceae bacterium]